VTETFLFISAGKISPSSHLSPRLTVQILGVVVQACNPRKAETGESEFKASWGSIGRPCLKKKGKKKKGKGERRGGKRR
jgi:hypothetical protein